MDSNIFCGGMLKQQFSNVLFSFFRFNRESHLRPIWHSHIRLCSIKRLFCSFLIGVALSVLYPNVILNTAHAVSYSCGANWGWLPYTHRKHLGQNFTQYNQCGSTQTAVGTKDNPNYQNMYPVPARSTVCKNTPYNVDYYLGGQLYKVGGAEYGTKTGSAWTPSSSNTCSTTSLTQTNECPGQTRVVLGTKNCDVDADGVSNSLDQCPNTAQGATVDVDGCSVNQLTEICFYDYSGFNNLFYCSSVDEPNLPTQYRNDINSITVPNGYVLITYSNENYVNPLSGNGANTDYIYNWERQLKSYKIQTLEEAGVCFFDYSNYRALFFCTYNDVPNLSSQYLNDINSIKLPPNYELTTYRSANYVNQIDTYTGEVGHLSAADKEIRSFKITNLDEDSDGVLNSDDLCPNTPTNETANIEGCSANQVLSAQPDGVCLYSEENYAGDQVCYTTDIDSLPNGTWNDNASSIGVKGDYYGILYQDYFYGGWSQQYVVSSPSLGAYNNNGSSLKASENDDDSDGVVNSLDQCAATPSGETVDANGCSQSQLDDDNDGVMNDQDLCPSTGSGETVNQYGCTQADDNQDTDGDGVPDYLDQCPNTLPGETADGDGCAPDQIDSDGDGTPDYLDAYPYHGGTQCPIY